MIEDGREMSLVDGVSRVKSESGGEVTMWIRGRAFHRRELTPGSYLYCTRVHELPDGLIQEIREAYCQIVRVEVVPAGTRWELGLLLVWIKDDQPDGP